MLLGARRLKDEGVDVVVGLVETHGRAETGALLEGLEVLPRNIIDYHGRTIAEFDIDAALERKPTLIVVDELAHTNAPDSRHPKRWQDVQELIAAGIDVWTALNIQHLESLADVVSRITGVTVRETVPDRVLQEAHDVVLVDITPDELIQRLNEGKVYVPETARRAIQNFFTAGNLTALRELALRRTADRVDDQMVDISAAEGDRGPVGGLGAPARLRRGDGSVRAGGPPRGSARDFAQRRLDGGLCRTVRPRERRQAGEPARQDLQPRRAARRRHHPGAGRRLRRGDPAPRAARERDPDRARPVACGNAGAPFRPLPARRRDARVRARSKSISSRKRS